MKTYEEVVDIIQSTEFDNIKMKEFSYSMDMYIASGVEANIEYAYNALPHSKITKEELKMALDTLKSNRSKSNVNKR